MKTLDAVAEGVGEIVSNFVECAAEAGVGVEPVVNCRTVNAGGARGIRDGFARGEGGDDLGLDGIEGRGPPALSQPTVRVKHSESESLRR